MVQIVMDGRRDVDEYFRSSGIFDSERLAHTPLLAFLADSNQVTVRIIEKMTDLLALPDDTPVMGQWRGEWRSDFFQFQVAQCRQYLETKLAKFKAAQNVTRIEGPQGGFKRLKFEYVDENGRRTNHDATNKFEAQVLEEYFSKQGIPIVIQKGR